MERIMCVQVANLFSRLVAGCAGHPDVPQAHRWGVLYGSSRVQVLAAVHDAALQFFHNHLGHVFGQSFAMPSQLILCSWDHKNTASLWWKANAVYRCTLYVICDQRVTWNAFALDSFGNDGSRLMACMAQSLAELLHAVSIHNDSVPTRRTKTHIYILYDQFFFTKVRNKFFYGAIFFYLYAFLPKSFTAFLISLHMMLQGCRISLAQTVDVHDGHQVVQLVVGGKRHGLPHCSFWHLTIPQQAENTVTEANNIVRWRRGVVWENLV